MTFTTLLIASTALASSQLGAHVHGTGELAIAIEADGTIQIQLDTPAYNLYGFEYEPRTDDERASVAAAEAILDDAGTLFGFGAADCAISRVGQDDHGHDEHDHEAHDHEEHAHSDVSVTYSGQCAQPDQLSSITTTLLVQFEELSTLNGIFLSPNQQLAFELTGDATETRLAR